MLSIAWNNLTHEKGRFIVSVGGVAFAVVMVLLLWGLYAGWNNRMTQYIESVNADFWVAQKGAADLSHSVSILKSDLEDTLAGIDGVASVKRFIGRQIAFDLPEEKDVHVYVVGFDPRSGENGPITMIRGSRTPREKEIIIDRAFSKNYGLDVGDTIPLKKGEQWTVVGIADGGNQVIRTYAFVNLDEAERMLDMTSLTNYFLVTVQDGQRTEVVQERIESAADVQATPRDKFIVENKRIVKETFLPIVLVLLVVAFAIGAAVIGLIIYTATIEKASEYGVLKALGFSRWSLYYIVLAQSLFSGVLGYAAGVGVAYSAAWLIQIIEPSFITDFQFSTFLWVLGMTVMMALVAAWAPTHRIASIDPTEVFRA